MIRNVVFDMGMVLMQWNPINPCLRYARDPEKARTLCQNIFEHPEWGQMIDGGLMTEEDYFERCANRMPTEELAQMCRAMSADWTLDSLYPTTGMQKVLEDLHRKGVRLYILSNCGCHFNQFEYRLPGNELFSGKLISAEEKMIKPNREIYERLLEKFDLVADECVFVDDLQKNIDAAEEVGIHGYCFADGDVKKLHETLNAMIQA